MQVKVERANGTVTDFIDCVSFDVVDNEVIVEKSIEGANHVKKAQRFEGGRVVRAKE